MLDYYWNPEAMQELGDAIAIRLVGGWERRVEDDYGRTVILRNTEGAAISIVPNSKGRLIIRGQFPHISPYALYDLENGRITVSAKKDAAAIAKDIQRRCLTKYLPAYNEAVVRKKAHEEAEARQEAQLKKLAAILGVSARQDRIYINRDPCGYGNFEMRNADSIYISLRSVPFELACKIAALLVEEATS